MPVEGLDDIPDTGSGIGGRVLATEIKLAQLMRDQKAVEQRHERLESRIERLFWVVLGGSFAVMVSVISAAIYVGGRFQAVEDIERRVTRIEDRPTLMSTSGGTHR